MHLQALRREVRSLLDREAWPELAVLAGRERRVLTVLVALTYENDDMIVQQAIEGFGVAAGAASDLDAEFVRGHLRRIVWLMSDESGGICWRGPELLAEALSVRPERFAAFLPILASLMDTEPEDADRFRESWERAMTRVSRRTP